MSVENVVGQYLEQRHMVTSVDLFPMEQEESDEDEEDSVENIIEAKIQKGSDDWIEKLHTSTEATLEAIKKKQTLLYQPSFLRKNN